MMRLQPERSNQSSTTTALESVNHLNKRLLHRRVSMKDFDKE
jgi:hypothetical protein